MARAPRASVPKTSGAGVSRLSYQKGYAKGNRGGAAAGGAVPGVQGGSQSITDAELKGAKPGKVKGDSSINVSYGSTLPIGDLKDVADVSKTPPPSSKALNPKAGPKLELSSRDRYAKRFAGGGAVDGMLPSRMATKALSTGEASINDYAKATPMTLRRP